MMDKELLEFERMLTDLLIKFSRIKQEYARKLEPNAPVQLELDLQPRT